MAAKKQKVSYFKFLFKATFLVLKAIHKLKKQENNITTDTMQDWNHKDTNCKILYS